MSERAGSSRVLVFGGTGLAGSGIVQACLAEPRIAEVRAVTRRPLDSSSAKLREVVCPDFADLRPIADSLRDVDATFYALGISATQVSGEDEYRVITYDYALEAARAVADASPGAVFHFLSGSGTSTDSRMMWARVKGETERELQRMDLSGLVCWRPAMILGTQPPRGIGWTYRTAYPLLRLSRYVPALSIENVVIGQAMLQADLEGRRSGTVAHREMHAFASRYRKARPPGP